MAEARAHLDELVSLMSDLMVHGRREDLERFQNARPWWLKNGPEIVRLMKEANPPRTYMRDRSWYLENLYSHPTLGEVPRALGTSSDSDVRAAHREVRIPPVRTELVTSALGVALEYGVDLAG